MAFYRFTRACRQVIINYLREELQEPAKHWDGSEWIELPSVTIIDARAYDPRNLPVIVTDNVIGSLQGLSFNQVVADWIDEQGIYGAKFAAYEVLGGRGNFDITILCAANDREIQQQLTDVTAFTLTLARRWMYYNRHLLLGEVRISGDGVDDKNAQEPVYFGTLVVPATADWRLIIPRDQVKRINPDVELVTPDDPFELPEKLPPPGTITPLDPEDALQKWLDKKVETTSLKASPDLFVDKGDALPLRPMKSGLKQW